MIELAVVVFLTIFISLNCSLYEAVLYSTRVGALEAAKARGGHLAAHMLALKRHIAGPIAAILILNTVANTAGAALSGSYAGQVLADHGPWAVPLFSAGLTLAILLVSEIIPKTAGAVYWQRLWPWIVWPILLIRTVLGPFVFLVQRLSNLIAGRGPGERITDEEILGLTRLGAAQGEINEAENRMVHRVMELEETRVRDVMTPRTVVFCLPEGMPVKEALRLATERGFTRVPVYRDDPENIIGYVTLPDLADVRYPSRQEAPIRELTREIDHVPEAADCLRTLSRFLRDRVHIAGVLDEYGGLAGIVTLEDLIEKVLGREIVDERDLAVDMQAVALRRARGE